MEKPTLNLSEQTQSSKAPDSSPFYSKRTQTCRSMVLASLSCARRGERSHSHPLDSVLPNHSFSLHNNSCYQETSSGEESCLRGREGMTCINYQRTGRRQPREKCPEVRVPELGRHLANFAGDLPSFLGI